MYNDLKSDNICIGNSDEFDPLCDLKLIDFGLTTSYVKIESLYREPKDEKHHIDLTK